MYRKCLIYESDRDEAKDILQDSFIKIFRNIGSFDGKRPIRAWMLKITTNTAIDHFRRSTKVSGYIPIDNIDPPDISEESITAALNGKDIISQVNRLPDGARMIFKLHAIEGYTHREIAHLLHISEGTSKSQINRAKHLLQQWIGSAC